MSHLFEELGVVKLAIPNFGLATANVKQVEESNWWDIPRSALYSIIRDYTGIEELPYIEELSLFELAMIAMDAGWEWKANPRATRLEDL